jgi:diguanylate cyclase (GGDEF)-like protein
MKVLMVEDSEDDACLLCAELTNAGNELIYQRVDSDRDMKIALEESDWDIIIADHSMPSFSSIDALDVLKESGKDIPFIIYSNVISEQMVVSAMSHGAHDYIFKGNFSRLLPSILRELKNAGIRRAKQQADSHIYQLAYFDELTGLPKRNLFCEKSSLMLPGLVDSGNFDGLAAMYSIYMNHLMRINSTYGYAIGDTLIQQLAYRLSECVDDNCILARIGGNNFAFFKRNMNDDHEIKKFTDKIMAVITSPFIIDTLEFYVTLSIGVSACPEGGNDASTLLNNAESARSLAKKSYENNCKYYVKAMGEASSKRLALETSLRKAVERGELLLQYQPVIDLETKDFIAAEALVRWNHPEFGLLAPDKFIPLADETGLIIKIGEWVLQQACMQAKIWHDSSSNPISVLVNVSAVQLGQPQLKEHVANVLSKTGLHPALLELEITESVLMQDAEASINTLHELKEMGIKIAVDDFGTGYSSLAYLKRFPIDVLKIDRTFIRDLSINSDSLAIVTAITALAKSLNLTIVAEGVETIEQLEYLCTKKCDRAQGFLISKPLNTDALALSFLKPFIITS